MGFGHQMQNKGGTQQGAPLPLWLTPRYRFRDSRIGEVEHPASTNHLRWRRRKPCNRRENECESFVSRTTKLAKWLWLLAYLISVIVGLAAVPFAFT